MSQFWWGFLTGCAVMYAPGLVMVGWLWCHPECMIDDDVTVSDAAGGK